MKAQAHRLIRITAPVPGAVHKIDWFSTTVCYTIARINRAPTINMAQYKAVNAAVSMAQATLGGIFNFNFFTNNSITRMVVQGRHLNLILF
jgi:hypothetical protein